MQIKHKVLSEFPREQQGITSETSENTCTGMKKWNNKIAQLDLLLLLKAF